MFCHVIICTSFVYCKSYVNWICELFAHHDNIRLILLGFGNHSYYGFSSQSQSSLSPPYQVPIKSLPDFLHPASTFAAHHPCLICASSTLSPLARPPTLAPSCRFLLFLKNKTLNDIIVDGLSDGRPWIFDQRGIYFSSRLKLA